jgi:alpha-beta hydrolase superfamily lysophospholipase
MRKHLMLFIFLSSAIALLAQEPYTCEKNICYLQKNGITDYEKGKCTLDIYYPNNKKKFKTIVWFHGGALMAGDKEIPERFKNAGVAVVGVGYRLYPKVKSPAYIQDVAKSVAWTFKNIEKYGGDPSQIYVAGHSAGGYLTLMLALDKKYLADEGIDADSIKCYFPISGQTATHYTIRKERGISMDIPIVDNMAPLNNVRKLATKMIIITGGRSKEQMARYEENAYLKAVLEGIGNKNIPLYELEGFDHVSVASPACELIINLLKERSF